jgi:hypothetical protein
MRLDFGRPDASEYLAVLNGLLIFHTAVAEFSRETVARELGPDIAPRLMRPALLTTGLSSRISCAEAARRGSARHTSRPDQSSAAA